MQAPPSTVRPPDQRQRARALLENFIGACNVALAGEDPAPRVLQAVQVALDDFFELAITDVQLQALVMAHLHAIQRDTEKLDALGDGPVRQRLGTLAGVCRLIR